MKRIVCLFPARNNPCVAFVALLALGAAATAPNAAASTRPQHGGTLRVQMRERIATIDPRQWPSAPAQAAAAERLDSLVFDRLVRLDEHGTLQPALAISWQHDAQSKRWQFRLRDGVKFSDGSPLTPPIAALALQQLLGNFLRCERNSRFRRHSGGTLVAGFSGGTSDGPLLRFPRGGRQFPHGDRTISRGGVANGGEFRASNPRRKRIVLGGAAVCGQD